MEVIASVLNNYPAYREHKLKDRFFKHADIETLIQNKNGFSVNEAGKSVEGRSIYLLGKGTGPAKIFLWSQMHGDEATGTMALFDLFNFLEADDSHNEIRERLLKQCTLYFSPMINPDGAERFTRRNAQFLDINRDYVHQQTPEGKILRRLQEQIKPHFGFNLHDQSIRWSAGKSGSSAAISFLAPACDEELSINATRERAMRVIAGMMTDIHPYIPGHIGRFEEEHESRAFGDNFQKSGTSTILIEAGGYAGDREKQFLRQIYFASILSGLVRIAERNYEDEPIETYLAIPENKKRHYSLIIRNCSMQKSGHIYIADIGLVADEIVNNGVNPFYRYLVEDVGDLSGFYCYREVDATGLNLILIKPLTLETAADLILQDDRKTVFSIENGMISE